MLTFFRKIRKSLIDSSSARKYLVYAIGEIALVVIGILIALQINNWNQTRLDEQIETQVLRKLVRDLESDHLQFKQIDSIYQNQINVWIERKNLFRQQLLSDDDILNIFQIYGVHLRVINPQRTAFDEMLNSGKIYNISNESLVEQIIDYYQETDERKSQILLWKSELNDLINGLHMTDYWNLILDENASIKQKRELLLLSDQKTQIFQVLKRISGWGVEALRRDTDIIAELLYHNIKLSDKIQSYLLKKDKRL